MQVILSAGFKSHFVKIISESDASSLQEDFLACLMLFSVLSYVDGQRKRRSILLLHWS